MSATWPPPHLSPPEPGTWGRPLGMALVVHAALVAALAWGVGWQKDAVVVFEAELWSRLPQVAAPRAIEPEPEPVPVEPVVQTPPAPPTPAPAPPAPQAKTPQVVTQKTPPKPEPKPVPRPPAKQATAPERAQPPQAQREAERLARERAQQAQLEAERQRQMERMLGQANATGASRASGQSTQSSGPSASYAGKLVAAVRPNIVFTDVVAGNPRAEVELRAGPDGRILEFKLRQSSGSAAWDQAVLRAIERTGKLPLDESGRVPNSLILGFRPQD